MGYNLRVILEDNLGWMMTGLLKREKTKRVPMAEPAKGWMNPLLERLDPRRRLILGVVLLLGITLTAYSTAMVQGGFIWDDDVHLTKSPVMESVGGLGKIWFKPGATPQYYPLTFTSFWVQHRLFGHRAMGYHVVNVLLHFVSVVLVWRILKRLAVPGAILGAALFAVHPVQVETVAWVSELKNVQSGVFYLLAVAAYLRWAKIGEMEEIRTEGPLAMQGDSPLAILNRGEKGISEWVWYGVMVVCFVGALLSKTVTCTLPVVLAMLWWWKGTPDEKGKLRGWAKQVLGLSPLVVIGLIIAKGTITTERDLIGAKGADWDLSWGQRALIAGRASWFYAASLVWPVKLTFIYPRWVIEVKQWAGWIFPAGAVAVPVLLWGLRKQIGKGPVVGVGVFLITLLPALGFVNFYPMRYSFVADHFQYLACLGLLGLLAGGAGYVLNLLERDDRWMGYAATIPMLAVLCVLSLKQGRIYKDVETLWRDTVAKNEGCWMAQENLANLLQVKAGVVKDSWQRERYYLEAIERYKLTIKVKPDYAKPYNELGQAYTQINQLRPMMEILGQGLSIEPDDVMLLTSYAQALVKAGDYKAAVYQLNHALELAPRDFNVNHEMGNAQFGLGRFDVAMKYYRMAMEIDPKHPDPVNGLGRTLVAQGLIYDAITQFKFALTLKQDNAATHNNLGYALLRTGEKNFVDMAEGHFKKALEIQPDFAVAMYNLGDSLKMQGKWRESLAVCRRVLELDPKGYDAHGLMAELLSTAEDPQVKDIKLALYHANKAVELSNEKDAALLDMLAQIQADDQSFTEAIRTAEKALMIAINSGQDNQAAGIRARIASYRSMQAVSGGR